MQCRNERDLIVITEHVRRPAEHLGVAVIYQRQHTRPEPRATRGRGRLADLTIGVGRNAKMTRAFSNVVIADDGDQAVKGGTRRNKGVWDTHVLLMIVHKQFAAAGKFKFHSFEKWR
mgnify:CR=1 FL=1